MLQLVGLGLADETDVTVKGLELIKKAERVYLEAYTSILLVDAAKLVSTASSRDMLPGHLPWASSLGALMQEAYYGRSLIIADREMVESSSDEILAEADKVDVVFLVVGDPFGATTHTDLVLRARELKIPVQTVHNASIMSAIGATGLQLYNFGQAVSMVFFTETWKPSSYYDRIQANAGLGLHTLVLLDIKVREQSMENVARGRKIYEPARYMTVAECARQMIETEEERAEGTCARERLAVGVARVGAGNQAMVSGTLEQLTHVEMGAPLHSVVLLGKKTHDLERDFIREWALDPKLLDEIWRRDYEGK